MFLNKLLVIITIMSIFTTTELTRLDNKKDLSIDFEQKSENLLEKINDELNAMRYSSKFQKAENVRMKKRSMCGVLKGII